MGLRRLPLALVAVAAAIVFWAQPAAAHALLVTAHPAPGGMATLPVRSVTLNFTDDIDSSLSHFTVRTAAGGSLATTKPAVHGATVTIPTDIERAGVVVVSWVAIGDDGHPVQGQYLFSAVAPGAKAATVSSRVFSEGNAGSPSLWWWIKAGRFAEVVLLYAVLGTLLVRVLVLRGLSAEDPAAARTNKVLLIAGVALGALSPPLFLLYAARLHQATGSGLATLLLSSVGRPWIAKVVLWEGFAIAVVAFTRSRPTPEDSVPGDWHDLFLLGCAALGAGAYVANTHAAAASPHPWWGLLMWFHIMVTALWAGGLGALILLILPAAGTDTGSLVIHRFSSVMTLVVGGIILSGAPLLWKLTGSWQRAWCSSFGVTAGFKLAVVAIALMLGTVNNRLMRFVGRTRRGATRALAVTHRLMAVEALTLFVALGLSAALGETALPPAIKGALLPAEAQASVNSGLFRGGCLSTHTNSSARLPHSDKRNDAIHSYTQAKAVWVNPG